MVLRRGRQYLRGHKRDLSTGRRSSEKGTKQSTLRISGSTGEVNEVKFTPKNPRYSECYLYGKTGHLKRNCPENSEQKSDNETPTKGSLRSANLLDEAGVYGKMKLSGAEAPCLMDTGCEITMVPRSLVQRHPIRISPTKRLIWAANGSEIELYIYLYSQSSSTTKL